jgi:type IV pilus assembly protein PilQ
MKIMAHIKNLFAATGRGALVLSLVCTLGIVALGNSRGGATAAKPPVAQSVRAITSGAATLITITGTAPMAYTVRRPDARQLVVELPGVDGSQLSPSYSISSPLVEGMSVKQTLRGSEQVASLHVALRAAVRERSHMEGSQLIVELMPEASKEGAAVGSSSADDHPQSRPSATPTPQNLSQMPPASQGQQYGQSGFIGEPISLNVVNADIRDILNYITEQYGVNFVVDSSVEKVSVTINVTDVPWNFALDSILKANRLGIEVTGNILRVATLKVLKEEAQLRADEEAARAKLKDAQLENSPLVTEFIRLNYARASGTLAGQAGSSGDFAGGRTQVSFSGGASGDSLGSSGEKGILPIIARRLSRRGGVEVDGRTNTLIITDVKENIDAVRRLVELLDQPEPQVEIETRIVLANRNFSRDLGVQLSAVAINNGRGSLGSFSTLRAGDDIAPGVGNGQGGSPDTRFGLPGGLGSTSQPTGTLGATAASTVIGLTTGIIGTAQISALITAAETKGQAKIIATPRVTALNNRSAQIESGSQIPVVTPQTGSSGGASVFTTTFVSVPLRLSVTPQITDAGTVVLRIAMENNSVNLTLTNSLGTPGIDTQRMSTEVLVPDGGTTVVGGVLNDRESETQNRTPGLSSLPVLGNLFKRKAITRNTDEILFFITPRIYRPDYQGRRVEQEPSTGTRSVQIPQPVPLGNPSTNTPAPNSPAEQQRQQQQQQQQGPVQTPPDSTNPPA